MPNLNRVLQHEEKKKVLVMMFEAVSIYGDKQLLNRDVSHSSSPRYRQHQSVV